LGFPTKAAVTVPGDAVRRFWAFKSKSNTNPYLKTQETSLAAGSLRETNEDLLFSWSPF
jgi:hypothetical protein